MKRLLHIAPSVHSLVATSIISALGAWSFSVYAQNHAELLNLYRSGKTDQALKKIDELLAQPGADPQVLLLRGVILAERGQTNEAIKIFQSLISDHPHSPEPYNNLAVMYAQSGQYDKARSVLELAIRTHPSYAVAYENLGDIYAQLASQSYARALNLNHRSPQLQPKLRLLSQVVALTPSNSAAPSNPRPRETVAATAQAERAAPSAATSVAPSVSDRPDGARAAASGLEKEGSAGSAALPTGVSEALENWRAAWSSRDVERYLAAYVADFRGGHASRKDWEDERRKRIAGRKRIDVELSHIQSVSTAPDIVAVRFTQRYRSDNLNSVTKKELVFKKVGDRWLISQETSVSR